ncbi:Mannosyl phosphorylinositol ceramide synthase SUR1 [Candida viswanathii]|uniref:inositol phosphorylceramide mannosyltransferase n=1 Tax=Candida viswanathii TaxID=5486 RepID=A0A367YPP3_9ASCO|nr:Mannosyl phosphorylinositol ceramide synthase SUR1 [Candida viswanathii]
MKKELKIIIWAHVALVVYLLYLCFDLLTLIPDDMFSDALLDVEINPSPNSPKLNKPAIIPKIIHQTYKTNDVPEIWKQGQQACINLHSDYQYILWTDEMAREFISKEFSWFLETWDNYKYPIQRADAIRYFVLYHFGGIYIDLDDGCKRKLDPLLTVPAFVRKTIPTGVSNDVMGSVPNHPFFLKVIQNLEKYQRNWFVPYLTIMISTGPLFLSLIWKQYKRWGVPEAGKVRIMMPEHYKGNRYSYFAIASGSSWHMGDANFIKGLGDHLVLAVIGGFLLAIVILAAEYLFYCWVTSNSFKKMINKIISIMWSIFMGFLRFLHLDKFLTKDSLSTCNSSIGGGHDYNELLPTHKDDKQSNLSSMFNILGHQAKIKRRTRKDSNLPIEIDLLDKLSDETVVIEDNNNNKSTDSLLSPINDINEQLHSTPPSSPSHITQPLLDSETINRMNDEIV